MKPLSQHRFYSFVKAPVVRLKKLIVREVATDRKAIFLVSPSSQIPEMYEIVCESAAEKKRWVPSFYFSLENRLREFVVA